jgi:hypothetical protein
MEQDRLGPLHPSGSVFNALNASSVLTVLPLDEPSHASYLQPATILQPRMFRLGLDVKW